MLMLRPSPDVSDACNDPKKCVMSSSALVEDVSGRVLAAWETEEQVFYSRVVGGSSTAGDRDAACFTS